MKKLFLAIFTSISFISNLKSEKSIQDFINNAIREHRINPSFEPSFKGSKYIISKKEELFGILQPQTTIEIVRKDDNSKKIIISYIYNRITGSINCLGIQLLNDENFFNKTYKDAQFKLINHNMIPITKTDMSYIVLESIKEQIEMESKKRKALCCAGLAIAAGITCGMYYLLK